MTITATTPIIPPPALPSVMLFTAYRAAYVGAMVVAARPTLKEVRKNIISADLYLPRCARVGDQFRLRLRDTTSLILTQIHNFVLTDRMLFEAMELKNGLLTVDADLRATPLPLGIFDFTFSSSNSTGTAVGISLAQRYSIS
jgi:hypothetical protein